MAHSQTGCQHPAWKPTGKFWHFDPPLTEAQRALQDKEIYECTSCGTSKVLRSRKPK